jgi:hypothetical protein
MAGIVDRVSYSETQTGSQGTTSGFGELSCLSELDVTPMVEIVFSFAHAVWEPHFHHDARVLCRLEGELDTDPSSKTFLMGPDMVGFRNDLQKYLFAEIEGRVLHDGTSRDGGADVSDRGGAERDIAAGDVAAGDVAVRDIAVRDAATGEVVTEPLRWVLWDVRPTVEMITLVVAAEAERIASGFGFKVAELELWESARSGVVLSGVEIAVAKTRLAQAVALSRR